MDFQVVLLHDTRPNDSRSNDTRITHKLCLSLHVLMTWRLNGLHSFIIIIVIIIIIIITSLKIATFNKHAN